MKNKLLCCLFAAVLFITNVNATELNFYTNNNGVSFTKEEYDFISNFYFEGYQDYMTQEDYAKFLDSKIMQGEIKTIVLDESLKPRLSVYETPMKQLKLSSSCTDDCFIVTSLIWKSLPTVRSYDLIGAYFYNTSLAEEGQTTYLISASNFILPSYTTSSSSGISAAFKLPNTSESMKVVQQFTVKKRGSINVSYQHARKSITLANSKRYTLSRNGYGGVFDFDEGITNYYDAMGGISLELS